MGSISDECGPLFGVCAVEFSFGLRGWDRGYPRLCQPLQEFIWFSLASGAMTAGTRRLTRRLYFCTYYTCSTEFSFFLDPGGRPKRPALISVSALKTTTTTTKRLKSRLPVTFLAGIRLDGVAIRITLFLSACPGPKLDSTYL